MLRVLLVSLSTVLLLIGCASEENMVYSVESATKIDESDKFTKEQKKLFTSAVANAEKENINLEGLEISNIIETEKQRIAKKEAEEKAKREELAKQKKEQEKALKNAVTVTLLNKELIPADTDQWRFSDIIIFDLEFKNNTEKAISGFKGVFTFKDMFDDEIYTLSLSYDEGVEVNSPAYWTGEMEVNEFIDKHLKLANIEFANLKYEFDIEQVVFSDGSTLGK